MSQLIEEMIENWGQQFQALNNIERLRMIHEITENLSAQEDEEEISYTVHEVIERLNELNTRDKLNLIQALINQVINPC